MEVAHNMKKKSGYALIMSVVVVSLLFILASSILALSVSAFKVSRSIEESNKVKLAAESGIEKGKLMLKNYIMVNTNYTPNVGVVAFNYLDFNPDDMNNDGVIDKHDRIYTDSNNINISITFGPNGGNNKFFDTSTGRSIKYITIDATAEKGNIKKTYSVTLDKSSLTNVYFNQIFNNTMTTADHIYSLPSDDSTPSLKVDAGVKLDITGNLFFQGTNLDLFGHNATYNFKFDEGKITANTNALTTEVQSLLNSTGKYADLFKNDNHIPKTGWVDTVPRYLKVLKILAPPEGDTTSKIDPILKLEAGTPIDYDPTNYIKFKNIDPFTNVALPGNPTLITYKVNKKQSTGAISFQELISGTNLRNPLASPVPNVYQVIINRLMTDNGYTLDQAKENYKNIYKLILVDGDLTIDDDFQEQFINYLVYCTGTVTFKGEAHFYNSSIFAQRINISDISVGTKGVQFYGVKTNKALAYTSSKTLNDYSDTDKMIINDYLIKNLEGYADSIEYKTIQYK